MASESNTCVLITGANRGFGLAVAHSIATHIDGIELVLIGRALVPLVAAANELHEVPLTRGHIDTTCIETSFTPSATYAERDVLPRLPRPLSSYAKVILINNAGTLGAMGRVRNLNDLSHAMDVNVYAPAALTNAVLDACFGSATKHRCEVVVVNVSSLCAVQPYDGLGSYCISKSAREMYFRTLALEEVAREKEEKGVQAKLPGTPANDSIQLESRVKVLNYAPGPMSTEMNKKLRDELPNPALREGFKIMFEKDQLVDPIYSATVL
ncbi:hypothetical protein HDU98_000881, partial [Podochytrium sp. JEL0797]